VSPRIELDGQDLASKKQPDIQAQTRPKHPMPATTLVLSLSLPCFTHIDALTHIAASTAGVAVVSLAGAHVPVAHGSPSRRGLLKRVVAAARS
jgi:kynurenine formamidase